MNTLKKIRTVSAFFFITIITLLFLDFTGTVHKWFGWMAKIQFLPALFALNVAVIIGLIVLTLRTYLLFGYLSFRYISGCNITHSPQKEPV